MRVDQATWMQVEERIRTEDRCVLPLGCTEQHAFLSLATDTLLAERLAREAAEATGVPVYPCLPYGMTPQCLAYPGTVSLSWESYTAVLGDVLGSLEKHGHRRVLIVNGHGGNSPAKEFIEGLSLGLRVVWHDWWRSPAVWRTVQAIDPLASHASWMENFPWTRVSGVSSPAVQKPMIRFDEIRGLDPEAVREAIGDGSFGGFYSRNDDEMLKIWEVAVEETVSLIQGL